MKPPVKTLDDIREERQKVLDKRSRLLYNIRRRFGGIRDVDLIYNPKISQNLQQSRDVNDRLYAIAKAVRIVNDKGSFQGRAPVIAGGSVRDMVFGLPVKDYDIFMDISQYDEDVQDDMVLLMTHSIMKEMGLNHHAVRNVTAETDYNGAPGFEAGFVVYEIQPDWDQMDFAVDEFVREADSFKPIQVIGRKDKRLLDDPVEFLADFDYGLVRGLFDPQDDQYKFHETFAEQLGQKFISYKDDRTYRRLRNWENKWSSYGYKFPFILKNEMQLKPAKTSFYTKSRTSTTANWPIQELQVLNWDFHANQPMVNAPPAVNPMADQLVRMNREANPIWRQVDQDAVQEFLNMNAIEQERDPFDELNN